MTRSGARRVALSFALLVPVLGPACASEEAAGEQAGEQVAPEQAGRAQGPSAAPVAPAPPRPPSAPSRAAMPPAPAPEVEAVPPPGPAGPERPADELHEADPEVAFPPVPAPATPGREAAPHAPAPVTGGLQAGPAPWAAPELPGGGEVQPAAQAISLAVGDTDVRAAAQMIAELAGVQLELHPWVQGRVSLHLAGVPWRNALESLLAQAGEFELVGQGGLLVVVPRPMVHTGEVVAVEGDLLRLSTRAGVVELHVLGGGDGLEAWRGDALRHLLASLAPGQRVSCIAALRGERLFLLSAAAAAPDAPGDR